jgi:hypothetical protein
MGEWRTGPTFPQAEEFSKKCNVPLLTLFLTTKEPSLLSSQLTIQIRNASEFRMFAPRSKFPASI